MGIKRIVANETFSEQTINNRTNDYTVPVLEDLFRPQQQQELHQDKKSKCSIIITSCNISIKYSPQIIFQSNIRPK